MRFRRKPRFDSCPRRSLLQAYNTYYPWVWYVVGIVIWRQFAGHGKDCEAFVRNAERRVLVMLDKHRVQRSEWVMLRTQAHVREIRRVMVWGP